MTSSTESDDNEESIYFIGQKKKKMRRAFLMMACGVPAPQPKPTNALLALFGDLTNGDVNDLLDKVNDALENAAGKDKLSTSTTTRTTTTSTPHLSKFGISRAERIQHDASSVHDGALGAPQVVPPDWR